MAYTAVVTGANGYVATGKQQTNALKGLLAAPVNGVHADHHLPSVRPCIIRPLSAHVLLYERCCK